MRTLSIRLIAIVLLLCFSINAILYTVCFNIQEVNLKALAQRVLSNDRGQLQIIKVPLAKFDKNNADEIIYNSKFYDVASYNISGDSVSILVYHDEKEETLFAANAEHFRHGDDNIGNWDGNHINKKNSAPFTEYTFFSLVSNCHSAAQNPVKIFSSLEEHPNHISIKIFFPPPDGFTC